MTGTTWGLISCNNIEMTYHGHSLLMDRMRKSGCTKPKLYFAAPCTRIQGAPHMSSTMDLITHWLALKTQCQSWATHQPSLHRNLLNERAFLSERKSSNLGCEGGTLSATWRPPYDMCPTQFFMLFHPVIKWTVWHVILAVNGFDSPQNEWFS